MTTPDTVFEEYPHPHTNLQAAKGRESSAQLPSEELPGIWNVHGLAYCDLFSPKALPYGT